VKECAHDGRDSTIRGLASITATIYSERAPELDFAIEIGFVKVKIGNPEVGCVLDKFETRHTQQLGGAAARDLAPAIEFENNQLNMEGAHDRFGRQMLVAAGELPRAPRSLSVAITMDALVQIEGVWKSYGRTPAVKGLSLTVPAGSVYGFLGPNGAGKSTTIRMMLGLQRPDRGRISLFGRALDVDALARIGSLVEAPSLYLHLTGRENLEVHRRLLGAPVRAIGEALDTVGLSGAADRVVRGYSSGMKQRLGLAQALLGDPELLLLDEPTNGLDPAGIHEVRTLIRELPKLRGVTLFLSSHLLSEVEQVATHFAIISSGETKFEGTAEELKLRNQPVIVADVDEAERAGRVLRELNLEVRVEAGRVEVSSSGGFAPAEINALLVRAGIAVSRLVTRHSTLEDAFLDLTTERVVLK
jgi:ABC-type multidrug transport system ATPase subunit